MDIASSQIGAAVEDLAWEHGYVTLYHYGGTTGVAQVNDTDLHAEFSRIYIDLEQIAFTDMQLYDR